MAPSTTLPPETLTLLPYRLGGASVPMMGSALWERPRIYLAAECRAFDTENDGALRDILVATHDALGVYIIQGHRQALLPWAAIAAIVLDVPTGGQ